MWAAQSKLNNTGFNNQEHFKRKKKRKGRDSRRQDGEGRGREGRKVVWTLKN